jgi:hypothetical protein
MDDAVEQMKTYVAEIGGEAVMAFRAMDDDDARDMVSNEDGDVRQALDESSGVVRADGSPLWDGKSEIIARPATDAEDGIWQEARDAEISDADEGELIESEIDEDFDDISVYLIPVKSAENDEGDVASS